MDMECGVWSMDSMGCMATDWSKEETVTIIIIYDYCSVPFLVFIEGGNGQLN